MKYYPNALLVSGTGRNVGKTSLICRLIEKFSETQSIVCIKISPHFHKLTEDLIILEENEHFVVTVETDKTGYKDSSKYLQSGAYKSYYVQCNDMSVEEAFNYVIDGYDEDQLFVVESGYLTHCIKAGLSIQVTDANEISFTKRYEKYIDKILFRNVNFEYFVQKININKSIWELRQEKINAIV